MVDKQRPPRLTETFIRSIKEPGKRGDGRDSHGLAIIARKKAGGGLRLFWQQRVLIDDKQRTIGLGNYPEITLKMARLMAFENARKLALGEDILKPKRVIPTLADAFDELIALRTPEWDRKGEKKAKQTVNQWNLSKDEYCSSILHKRVSDINAEDVLDVLRPIWIDKSATANNVQSHLKQVMDWAIRLEYRTTNPAVRSNTRLMGTQPPPVHHPAAPYQDLGQYLAQIRDSDAWWGEKYCLLFMALTADRSGEAREATWDDVDMEKATLTIPAERMKGPDDHVVPLSTQAMDILRLAKRKGRHSRGTIFPPKRGGVFIGAPNLSALVPRQPFLPIYRRLVLPVHLLGRRSVGVGRGSLAALLCCVSPVAGDVKLQDDGVVDYPVNRCGGGHGVGEDALPLREDQVGRDAQGPAFVAFCDEGEEDLGLLSTLGQVAEIVQEQEVEVVQLAQLSGQVEVALGGEQVLHQTVGRCEEDGVASFHQAVAQGTERMGLAGAGEPEGQHVDAVIHETALGQLVHLLPQCQRHPVMFEGLPGLARGEPGRLTQPVDAPVLPILGLLLQHLQEGGQGLAVASLGETGHRLSAHGGQLEFAAELTDALRDHAGVGVHHAHTPTMAVLLVSRPS